MVARGGSSAHFNVVLICYDYLVDCVSKVLNDTFGLFECKCQLPCEENEFIVTTTHSVLRDVQVNECLANCIYC